MRYDSLKQLYEIIEQKLVNCKIILNDDTLTIENSSNHFIKIVFNRGFFDVYIDNVFYYDVDKFDIEGTIDDIMTGYILFKNNSVDILSPREYDKIKKRMTISSNCIIKWTE